MIEVWGVGVGLAVFAFFVGALPMERVSAPRWVGVALRVFRGAVPALLATRWFMDVWSPWVGFEASQLPPSLAWWVLLSAVLGDCMIPWFRRGHGTGVLTGLGGLAILSPWAALGAVTGALIGYVSVRERDRDVVGVLAGIFSGAGLHLVLFKAGTEIWVGAAMIMIFLMRYERRIDAVLDEPAGAAG